jgi:hypothetical protein
MKRHFVVPAVALVALVASCPLMAQGKLFLGTWKLNVALSQYDPGPPPMSQIRTWQPSGKVTVQGIDAKGNSRTYGYTIKADGKDRPTFGGGGNGAESVAGKRIDAHTMKATFKKSGKPIESAILSVSENGMRLTIVSRNSATNEKSFHNVQVWDKQ